jgi:hypothetical protein
MQTTLNRDMEEAGVTSVSPEWKELQRIHNMYGARLLEVEKLRKQFGG